MILLWKAAWILEVCISGVVVGEGMAMSSTRYFADFLLSFVLAWSLFKLSEQCRVSLGSTTKNCSGMRVRNLDSVQGRYLVLADWRNAMFFES